MQSIIDGDVDVVVVEGASERSASEASASAIASGLSSLHGSVSHFRHDVVGTADEQVVPNRRRMMKRVLRRCGRVFVHEGRSEGSG